MSQQDKGDRKMICPDCHKECGELHACGDKLIFEGSNMISIAAGKPEVKSEFCEDCHEPMRDGICQACARFIASSRRAGHDADGSRSEDKTEGVGVGMPHALKLDEFGSQLWSAFDKPAYLVGSALKGKNWRDVDVRMILDDDEYEKMGFGNPRDTHRNAKWVAYVLAFSALGREMTGLPIDFQIQQQTLANEQYPTRGNPRSALGIIELRITK